MERRKEDIFYESLIQHSPFGFAFHKIILDENGSPVDFEFIDINSAYERITGLRKNVVVGKKISDFFSLNNNLELKNRIILYGDVATNRIEHSFEQYSPPLRKWFKVNVYSPLKHFFVCVFIDITEEKREFAQIDEFFSLDLDLLCILDRSGNFIKVNRAWNSLLGYSAKDIEHSKYIDFVHPRDIEATELFHQQVLAGKSINSFVNRYRIINGTYKLIEWKWKASGNLLYVSARDISHQKIMETELIREKVLLKTILNGIPDIISLQKPDHTVISYNQAGYNFLKKTPAEVDGKKCYEILGQQLPCETCPVTDAIKTSQPASIESYIPQINLWFEATCIPIFEDDKAVMIVEVFHNITDRKKAEIEIIAAREHAEKANRFKSEFLANMSHEIRTPLNGVIGFAELLKNSGKLSQVQKEYAESAYLSASSLLGIINDILDFSKIEAGKLELDEIKTDIIKLVEQAADIIKFNVSQKNLELLLNIHSNVPRYAVVDPLRLKQILINLLGNAVKFTEKGEIEIKVSFHETDEKKGHFVFSVRDTGIGISEIQQKRLFNAFSQADASTTRKFGGTGLGLTISNKLLEKMDGKFVLESDIGKGSSFSFAIEKRFEYGEPLPLGEIADIKKILIIDDNLNNRTILSHTLKNWNIESVSAQNGIDGLEILSRHDDFDAIIIDYHMPFMDGIQIIDKMLKKNPAKKSVPVILLHSSSDDNIIFSESEKLGIKHKITKPVKSSELFFILQNLKENTVKSLYEKNNPVEKTKKEILKNNPVILIAEDVALNMNLVKTIISESIENPVFIEAGNGLEAVEKFRLSDPDIVLMDIQMPEMDGYTATRNIRKIEESKGSHCPVIALTAGTVKGEEKKCFEAGMDYFLTKPINSEELVNTLRKFLNLSASVNIKKQILNTGEEAGYFDSTAFLRGFNGNIDISKQFLSEAIVAINDSVRMLLDSLNNNDHENIKKMAHRLKGSALNMRFNKLGEKARIIENTIDFDREIIDRMTNELISEWEYTQEAIKKTHAT